MGLDEAVRDAERDTVAGVGFRREANAEDITQLVRIALDLAGVSRRRLRALATAEDRSEEAAFRTAAAGLGISGLGLARAVLQAVDARVPTRSARVEAARGVGSLAEAAALAAAGDHGRLVLSRVANAAGTVTCALALTREPL